MTTQLDRFESALLTRLREQVDQQPEARPRFSRPRLLLGAAAAVTAAVAMVVVVPGFGTTTAYSVQEGNADIITVKVERLEDADGLEAELAKYGIDADITYLSDRQECAPGRYKPVKRSLTGLRVTMGAEQLEVTLPPGTVRDGETFVMAVSGEVIPPSSSDPSEDGNEVFSGWTDFNVTAGPVPSCTVVPSTNG
jgi:hypothetical protein